MEGLLRIRRPPLDFVWHERFFLLQGNQLLYFAKEGEPTPRGTYILSQQCTIGEVFDSLTKHKHHEQGWMFRIQFGKKKSRSGGRLLGALSRKFIDLAAKTEEEAQQWRAAVLKAIDVHTKDSESDRKESIVTRDIGQTPAAVEAFLQDKRQRGLVSIHGDRRGPQTHVAASDGLSEAEDSSGLNVSDGVSPNESDTIWRAMMVDSGVTIMKEYPPELAEATRAFEMSSANNRILLKASALGLLSAGAVQYFSCPAFCSLVLGVAAALLCLGLLVHLSADMATACAGEGPPALKCSSIVPGTPEQIFHLLTTPANLYRWDSALASGEILEVVDEHTAILYLSTRPTWTWPFWHRPRDMCLLRYWRREEDGSYIIVYQSTTHPKLSSVKLRGHVRATMLGATFIIAPRRPGAPSYNGGPHALVTYTVRYDPGGSARFWAKLGRPLDFVLPQLKSVVALRDVMANGRFIEPSISVQGTGEVGESAADKNAAAAAAVSTSITPAGVVLGVKTLECSCPHKFWKELDASRFSVRGPNYLKDRKKVSADKALFHLVAMDLFAFEDPAERFHIAARPDGVVQRLLRAKKQGKKMNGVVSTAEESNASDRTSSSTSTSPANSHSHSNSHSHVRGRRQAQTQASTGAGKTRETNVLRDKNSSDESFADSSASPAAAQSDKQTQQTPQTPPTSQHQPNQHRSSGEDDDDDDEIPFTILFNLVVPTRENISLVSYFQPADDRWKQDKLLNYFIFGPPKDEQTQAELGTTGHSSVADEEVAEEEEEKEGEGVAPAAATQIKGEEDTEGGGEQKDEEEIKEGIEEEEEEEEDGEAKREFRSSQSHAVAAEAAGESTRFSSLHPPPAEALQDDSSKSPSRRSSRSSRLKRSLSKEEEWTNFRNNRFKLIPNISEGSFIIRHAVGSKPAIIGNKGVRIPYYQSEHYLEIDVDIASDAIANQVTGLVAGVTKSLVIDLAILIEAQAGDDLPERVLGTLRLDHLDLSAATKVPKSGGNL